MSSARDAGRHFPLHLLVWNNDYRQLEKELQGQVRGEAGGVGGRFPSLSPSPVLFPGAPQSPLFCSQRFIIIIKPHTLSIPISENGRLSIHWRSIHSVPVPSEEEQQHRKNQVYPDEEDEHMFRSVCVSRDLTIVLIAGLRPMAVYCVLGRTFRAIFGRQHPVIQTELTPEKLPLGSGDPVQNVEALDPRGRTLLHLAVSLGHLESARVLLRHKADAVSTGDPEMVYTVLQHRDYHNTSMALEGVPELLQKILEAPDFYVQMKWEFTSWVPLVSRICPNDVCRIWKSGAKLRVDITLLGFENMSWIRGRRSFIFKGEDNWAELMEVNHDDKVVTTEHFDLSQEMERLTLDLMKPKGREVERRLTSPVINTSLDTKNIAFERTKSGFWGWRTDKAEVVNGYEAKVYTVNNVSVITKIRTEHLTEEEKKRYKADRNPLESLLGTVEHQFGAQGDLTTECASANNPTAITPDEYFNEEFDLKDRDIGRPKELTIRTQKFKATLWMCEEFPLSLVEQVVPIIDLMARTSAHFARLRDFIKLEFPPGFPVKIEIPLFHVLNARITFGNVNGCSTAEETVSQNAEGTQADSASPVTNFEVDQSVFEIPESYHVQDNGRNVHLQDEDYEIMQFAIQQSLLESSRNQELSGPASNGGIGQTHAYDIQYERAIQESLLTSSEGLCPGASSETSRFDSDLQLAMELSAKELEERELQLRQEEAELQQVLQLSLTEK
ncbi:hypothetical protein HPG69_019234 [Diceros bicornis minor]|uniref:Ankyrin repeat domain-containing protein n=1 Tax=Diceros bicornis minor TaxID=77932 RepID=A0A7J7FMC7_DICBM|nr:hypothetical protein HPG69_019234 [Diceros bicornis minor]